MDALGKVGVTLLVLLFGAVFLLSLHTCRTEQAYYQDTDPQTIEDHKAIAERIVSAKTGDLLELKEGKTIFLREGLYEGNVELIYHPSDFRGPRNPQDSYAVRWLARKNFKRIVHVGEPEHYQLLLRWLGVESPEQE